MNFKLQPRKKILRRSLRPDINASSFSCLAPRPECGAGGVRGGLGEGAKPDAPFLFTEASKTAARKATIYRRDMLFYFPGEFACLCSRRGHLQEYVPSPTSDLSPSRVLNLRSIAELVAEFIGSFRFVIFKLQYRYTDFRQAAQLKRF